MGREKIGLIRLWSLVLFTLVYLAPQTVMSSKDETKTCNPSRCGFITNISYPFRLRDDPPNCGLRPFELACENSVALLHLHLGTSNSTYQVMGINYDNYTIRLRDASIREGDCSSLPRYFLSKSNFSDTYDGTYEYDSNKNPYVASLGVAPYSKLTFDHVIYLKCSDRVRDDAGYVDTAACVDWGSNGGGGGGDHVYAVVGDLEAERLKPECRVKSVATIDKGWRSFLSGKSYTYVDIHRLLSLGFQLSWWKQACLDHHCANDEYCVYDDYSTQKISCPKKESSCFSTTRVSFALFCGNMANLNHL